MNTNVNADSLGTSEAVSISGVSAMSIPDEIRAVVTYRDNLDDLLIRASERILSLEEKVKNNDGTSPQLAEIKSQLVSVQEQLSVTEDHLADTKNHLADAQDVLADKKSELTDTKKLLGTTQSQLTTTKTHLADTKTQLTHVKGELADSKAHVEDVEAYLAEATAPLAWAAAPGLIGDIKVDNQLSVDLGGQFHDKQVSIGYQWQADQQILAGQTDKTLLITDDLRDKSICCEVTVAKHMIKAKTPTAQPAQGVADLTPPVAIGHIDDKKYTQGNTVKTIDVSRLFSGDDITYSASGAGATVDGNGMVKIPVDKVRQGETVTVTATNPAGAAKLAFVVTVAAKQSAELTPTTMQRSVTDPLTGHVYTFAKDAEVGQYENGSWFVVEDPNNSIISISPEGATEDHPQATLNDEPRIMNGAVKNPFSAVHSQLPNGWDSLTEGASAPGDVYDPALDIDPTTTGNPIPLEEASIVKAESIAGITIDIPKTRNRIMQFSVLTVVKSVPRVDSFRPAMSTTSKISKYALADMDLSFLHNDPLFGSGQSYDIGLEDVQWTFASSQEGARQYTPKKALPYYGTSWNRAVFAALALHGDYPQEEKEKLARRIIQIGIDLYGFAEMGGKWIETGSKNSGRKWAPLFAAISLNDQEFKDFMRYENSAKYFANDDMQYIYVNQAIVDASQAIDEYEVNSKGNIPLPYSEGHLGLPELGKRSPENRLASELTADTTDWSRIYSPQFDMSSDLKSSYRNVIFPAYSQIAKWYHATPEAREYVNPAVLDYHDRVYRWGEGHRKGYWNKGVAFHSANQIDEVYMQVRDKYNPDPVYIGRPEAVLEPIVVSDGSGGVDVSIGELGFLCPDPSEEPVTQTDIRWRAFVGDKPWEARWNVIEDVGLEDKTSSYKISNVPGNTEIQVQIRAYNRFGVGAWPDVSPKFKHLLTSVDGEPDRWRDEYVDLYVSSATTADVTTVPFNAIPPKISDAIPEVGTTVLSDVGVWAGNPNTFTYAYKWQRSTDDGLTWDDIADEVDASYVVSSEDADNTLRVLVSASNDEGASTYIESENFIKITGVVNVATPTTPLEPDIIDGQGVYRMDSDNRGRRLLVVATGAPEGDKSFSIGGARPENIIKRNAGSADIAAWLIDVPSDNTEAFLVPETGMEAVHVYRLNKPESAAGITHTVTPGNTPIKNTITPKAGSFVITVTDTRRADAGDFTTGGDLAPAWVREDVIKRYEDTSRFGYVSNADGSELSVSVDDIEGNYMIINIEIPQP